MPYMCHVALCRKSYVHQEEIISDSEHGAVIPKLQKTLNHIPFPFSVGWGSLASKGGGQEDSEAEIAAYTFISSRTHLPRKAELSFIISHEHSEAGNQNNQNLSYFLDL